MNEGPSASRTDYEFSPFFIVVGVISLYFIVKTWLVDIDNDDRIVVTSISALVGGLLGSRGLRHSLDGASVMTPQGFAASGRRQVLLGVVFLLVFWVIERHLYVGALLGGGVVILWGMLLLWSSRTATWQIEPDRKEPTVAKGNVSLALELLFSLMLMLGLSAVYCLIGTLLMKYGVLVVYKRMGEAVAVPVMILVLGVYAKTVGGDVVAKRVAEVGLGNAWFPLVSSFGIGVGLYPLVDRSRAAIQQLKASKLRGGPLPGEDYTNLFYLIFVFLIGIVTICQIWEGHMREHRRSA